MHSAGLFVYGVTLFVWLAPRGMTQQWDWVQRFQGGESAATAIGLDARQNVYIAGTFRGTNQIGTNHFISAGDTDVFIAKLTPAGELVWAIATGGPTNDSIRSLLVASNGTLFVLGRFEINPALLAEAATNVTETSSNTLVLARVDDGRVTWFKTFPPAVGLDAAAALGPDESVWMTGVSNRVFVTEYDRTGAVLGGLIIGKSLFWPTAIAVGRDGVFLNASFYREVDLSGTNLTDWYYGWFTAGFDRTGHARWAWNLGENYKILPALAIGPDGSVTSVGYYDTGLPQGYAVIVKHSADGALLWVRELTGHWKSIYEAQGVAADNRGTIHVAGSVFRIFNPSIYRRTALWVSTFDVNGIQESEQFVKTLRLSGGASGLAIAVNADADLFVAGTVGSDPTFGTNVMGVGTTGNENAFVGRRPTLQPALNVRRAGTNILLNWPRTALPFALQTAHALSSNAWSDVSTAPDENAGRKQVLLPRQGRANFFRLRMTNEVPIEHVPLIWLLDLTSYRPPFLDRPRVYITTSNAIAGLAFQGLAEDADDDWLTFQWFDVHTHQDFTNGVTVRENWLSTIDRRYFAVTLNDPSLTFTTGTHIVSFVASDRIFSVTNSVTFEVIPIASALDELIAAVTAATTEPERSRLLAPLNTARLAIGTSAWDVVAEQMEEFRMRVEASTELSDSQKSVFALAVQGILVAVQ